MSLDLRVNKKTSRCTGYLDAIARFLAFALMEQTMTALRSYLTVVAAVCLLTTAANAADEPKDRAAPPATSAEPQQKPPPSTTPIYKPPPRGAPRGRIGGGTRGPRDSLLGLYVLAPDHTGLTATEQPDFYWHLSELTQYPIEFTLIEETAILPVVEVRISTPVRPGIQRIALSAYNVRLKENSEYRWFVAIIPDRNSRSKDILAGGFIRKITPSDAFQKRVAEESPERSPFLYAEEGIWYDALSAISNLIDAAPNDATRHRQRAELLEQVGLQEISADSKR